MKSNLKISILLILMILFTLNSCKKEVKLTTKKPVEQETVQKHKSCDEVHWSYHHEETAPENWKNLCDGFSDCGGKSQSPINIVSNAVENLVTLKEPVVKYGTNKVDVINNGHTVQFNIEPGNFVELNGKKYELLQFHFHALSEHTVDGKHFPLEAHFVHKNNDTDYAVLGVFFTEGESNPLLHKYIGNFPKTKGEFKSDETFSIESVLPKNKEYYYYKGSLTTPPCSEVVNWYVLKQTQTASKDELEKFAEILHNNYRPVMPLNERKVYTRK